MKLTTKTSPRRDHLQDIGLALPVARIVPVLEHAVTLLLLHVGLIVIAIANVNVSGQRHAVDHHLDLDLDQDQALEMVMDLGIVIGIIGALIGIDAMTDFATLVLPAVVHRLYIVHRLNLHLMAAIDHIHLLVVPVCPLRPWSQENG